MFIIYNKNKLNKRYKIHPSELERALNTNTGIKGLYIIDPEKEEKKRLRIPNRLERESESKGRKIIGTNPETGTEYMFDSAREAERELGINRTSIVHVLKGRQGQAGGWKWRYKDEVREDKKVITEEWVGREFILNGSIYLNVVDIEEKGEEIYIVMKDKNTGKLFEYTLQSLADNLQNDKLIENTSQKLSWKKIEGEDLIGRTFLDKEGTEYDILGVDQKGIVVVNSSISVRNNLYTLIDVKSLIDNKVWKDISTDRSIQYNMERVKKTVNRGYWLSELSSSQKLSWKEIPEDLTGWLVRDEDDMFGVIVDCSPFLEVYQARWYITEERAIKGYWAHKKNTAISYKPVIRNWKKVIPIRQIDNSIKVSSDQNFDLYKDQNKEMYRKRLEFYDENKGPEIFWSSKDAQEKRFEALLDIGDLTGREILDVGCGYGDLLTYIENKGINIERYVGVDIVPEIVKKGRELHEGVNITVRDIQKEPLEENSFDYVMGSGIFAFNNNEWGKYVVDMLKEMLKVSKIGVGVNFLKQQPLNRLSWKEFREGMHKNVFKYIDVLDKTSDRCLSKSEVVERLKIVFDDLDESTLENIYDEWRYDIESVNRMLSSRASFTSLKYNDPKQVVELVKKYVTEKVILKDNYLNDDFTLFLYKN